MGVRNDSDDKLMSRLADSVKEIAEFSGCRGVFKKLHGDSVRRIKLLSPLFEELRESDVKLSEGEIRGLEAMSVAFDSAKKLLRSVNGGSKLYQFFHRDTISGKFHDMTIEMEAALSQIPYDKIEISEDVREQVQLLHFQFMRAKGRQAESDLQLDGDLAIALNVTDPDPNVLKRLSHVLQLVTIDDLKREWQAICELSLLRDGDSGDCYQKVFSLLKKLVDRSTIENSEADTSMSNRVAPSHRSPVIPDDFLCPISHELMKDPVIISTGQTYERSYIRRWLNTGHRTCPKTQQALRYTDLTPNYALKSLIALWCESNGIQLSSTHDEDIETPESAHVPTLEDRITALERDSEHLRGRITALEREFNEFTGSSRMQMLEAIYQWHISQGHFRPVDPIDPNS